MQGGGGGGNPGVVPIGTRRRNKTGNGRRMKDAENGASKQCQTYVCWQPSEPPPSSLSLQLYQTSRRLYHRLIHPPQLNPLSSLSGHFVSTSVSILNSSLLALVCLWSFAWSFASFDRLRFLRLPSVPLISSFDHL